MGKTDLGSTAHDLPEDEPKEFWPDPWLDYDESRQQNNGNKPLSVLLTEMVTTLESLVSCEFVDHIQGTDKAEWKCPECESLYRAKVVACCACTLNHGQAAVQAATIVKGFLDESAAELLDRGYTLDKGTCMAHHTDSMGVKATRRRLFNDAAESFTQDRLTLKLDD